jgi:hypothetical protein
MLLRDLYIELGNCQSELRMLRSENKTQYMMLSSALTEAESKSNDNREEQRRLVSEKQKIFIILPGLTEYVREIQDRNSSIYEANTKRRIRALIHYNAVIQKNEEKHRQYSTQLKEKIRDDYANRDLITSLRRQMRMLLHEGGDTLCNVLIDMLLVLNNTVLSGLSVQVNYLMMILANDEEHVSLHIPPHNDNISTTFHFTEIRRLGIESNLDVEFISLVQLMCSQIVDKSAIVARFMSLRKLKSAPIYKTKFTPILFVALKKMKDTGAFEEDIQPAVRETLEFSTTPSIEEVITPGFDEGDLLILQNLTTCERSDLESMRTISNLVVDAINTSSEIDTTRIRSTEQMKMKMKELFYAMNERDTQNSVYAQGGRTGKTFKTKMAFIELMYLAITTPYRANEVLTRNASVKRWVIKPNIPSFGLPAVLSHLLKT